MGFLADQDTGAMCAVLLSIAAFPALVYAGYARFTGRGRKGGAPWRPLEDPINLICAAVAVAGHALASVVVGGWGELFGFMTPAFMGGCNSSALAYTCGGDGGGRAVRPALLLVVPYAFALGFFGRIAG
ncbi:hypothetical protein ABZY09_37840 [Streptomyces sp. NPDC002928]|uniref:hypothetical protein n=1 Tax=Streptomyces sp. NPDC002928 TaxID=3154440 RepID=UPI0033A66BFF